MRLLRRAAIVAAACAAAVATVSTVSTVPVEATTTTPPVRRFVTGWVPYWSPDSGLASITAHATLFSDASPFWFNTSGPGAVEPNGSASALIAMTATLHAHGIRVIPTVTSSMNADAFARLLSSRADRRAEIASLARVARRYGADGLDLDFESVNSGSDKARAVVLAKYPVLTQSLHDVLAADGRLLSVTLPARTSDTDPNWAVYDYARLGAAADRVRLMTYDYHWGGGSPGPIAPRSWVRSVVGYAVTRITPGKISFGLPSYGRDWYVRTVSGKCPASAFASVSRTTAQMQAFARARGIVPVWSARETSRTFSYLQRFTSGAKSCRVKRVAWYDDARSVRAKLRLVKQFSLRGVAFWALGYESSRTWVPVARFGAANVVQPATLAGQATADLTFGQSGAVAGTLRAGGHSVAHAPVTLQKWVTGDGWRVVARATTDANGHVRLTVRPRQPTSFRFVAGRTWSRTSATMAGSVVHVRYAVAVKPLRSRISVRPGGRVELAGKVQPGSVGLAVVLQARNGNRWVVRGTTSTRADGTFAFARRFVHPGRHQLRFVVPSGSLDRGASAPVTVHVR